MGHIDRIDLLVEDGESPFGVGVLGSPIATGQAPSCCSPRMRVICRLLRSSTMRDACAGCRKASSTGSAARHGATDPANRPANSAGINDHFMRRTRLAGLNVFIAARKNSSRLGSELFRISLVSWSRSKSRLRPPSALLSHERCPSQSKDLRCC